MYIQVSPLSPVTLMTDYLARMNTALKGTAGLRDVNGLISLKAILKYRHGSLPQKNKLSRELAPASRNHEVPWLYQCGAKSRVFEKAVSIRAKKHSPVPIIFNLHTEKVQLIINTDCS